MGRVLGISVAAVLAAAAIVYESDYGVLRYRVSRNLSPYDSVTVLQYYAIQDKNQRTEYVTGPTEQEPCVNSLFPHFDLAPCWYLRRHSERQVKI